MTTTETIKVDWKQAACRDEDPELFFHPDGESRPLRLVRIAAASQVCSHCPIKADCLGYALETFQEYGVWGGTGEDHRRALRDGLVEVIRPTEFEDGRDTTVIALLVAGADVVSPDLIDVAHAAVQLFHQSDGDTSAVARRLDVSGDQVRKWVRRDGDGELLIQLRWLECERRRAARIQLAVAS